MPWILGAIAISGTLGSFTDWLFMGRLFHDAYDRYPEVWRPGVREGRGRNAILLSAVLGYLISAAVVGLCLMADTSTIGAGLLVGLFAWCAGPLVVVIVNGLFIKIDRKITFAHALGYLARILLAGAAGGWAVAHTRIA